MRTVTLLLPPELDELLEELDELDELELDELELLEDEPPQSPTGPPSPYWSLQVSIPIQLWLFSHPQPLVWFWHIGRTSPYQLHWHDDWACAWEVKQTIDKNNVLRVSHVNLLNGIFFIISPRFCKHE